MHIRWPVGKHFDKKYVVATMIWHATFCHGAAGLYFIQPNTTMNGPKYVVAQRDAETAHAHP